MIRDTGYINLRHNRVTKRFQRTGIFCQSSLYFYVSLPGNVHFPQRKHTFSNRETYVSLMENIKNGL